MMFPCSQVVSWLLYSTLCIYFAKSLAPALAEFHTGVGGGAVIPPPNNLKSYDVITVTVRGSLLLVFKTTVCLIRNCEWN